jgi:hypothetical protein
MMIATITRHHVAASFLALTSLSIGAWAQTQVALPPGQSGGGTYVSGAPVSAMAKTEQSLTYRDPSQPLSIGEIADLQAKEEAEKFLKKHGFTGEMPAPVIDPAAATAKPAEPAPNQLKLMALYGQPQNLHADLSINQVVHQVRAASAIDQVRVERIGTASATVTILKGRGCTKNALGTAAAKKANRRGCVQTTHDLAVGDMIEWR